MSTTSIQKAKQSKKQGPDWPDSWFTLEHGLRVGRYTDPEFLKLEFEKLWPKVWQVATRVDEIPEPNDFATYTIGDQSVFLVRIDENTVKAYHNVCPHRGTALTQGSGTFDHGRIICPFHGWRWNTEGDNEYILIQEQFRDGKLCNSDANLKELHCEVYGGFIFINFDKNCQPFDEFIEPIRFLLDGLNMKEMRHYWWKKMEINSNWKIAQEAFYEGYHVPATHPQLEKRAAEYIYGEQEGEFVGYSHENVLYETFENGHGRFYAGQNSPMRGKVNSAVEGQDPFEAMADRLNLLCEGMDAQVLPRDIKLLRSLIGSEIPEGSSAGAEYIKAQYATAAAENRPMPDPTPEMLGMWGGEVMIFPNVMILPQAGNAMIYRTMPHPTNPDKCTFEIFSTCTLAEDAPRERAKVINVTDAGDPDQVYLIPRQDLGNLERMQIGLHSNSIKQVWMAKEQEKVIMGMHRELDTYLTADD